MTPSLEARLRTDLTRVAQGTAVPPAPTSLRATPTPLPEAQTRHWARRHRAATAAAALAAVSLIGVPVAAAAGLLPGVRAAFGWSRTLGPLAAKEGTGRLVLTTTGPGGQPMELYVAETRDGGRCTSLILPRARGGNRLVDAGCAAPASITGSLGGLQADGSAAGPRGEYAVFSAPGAARLTLSDGASTRSLPVADGLSGAWIPAGSHCGPAYPTGWARTLTLTSYGPSGARLGRIRIFAGDPSWLVTPAGRGSRWIGHCPG